MYEVTDFEKLGKYLALLDVQLCDEDGLLRNFGDVIDDMSEIWDTLDKDQKKHFSEKINSCFKKIDS